ncbi:MAG: PEP-CTERM sorting domain-containing protein [Gemmatimonadaceae bacterium]
MRGYRDHSLGATHRAHGAYAPRVHTSMELGMASQWSLARALAAAALLVAPQITRATPVCGGSTFTTCASVTVTKVLLSNGNVRVRFEVMNQAGLGESNGETHFTYVGLWGLPSTASYADSSVTVGGSALPSDWRAATPSELDDPEKFIMRADMRGVRLRPGIFEGLRAGQIASFEFDLTGVRLEDVNVNNWEIHGAIGRAECVTDLVAKNGTLNEARMAAPLCSAVITPEPATFVLFATGLAAMGGIVLRRRRYSR